MLQLEELKQTLLAQQPKIQDLREALGCDRLLEEKKGKTVLALGGAAEGSFLYVLGSRDGDMRRLSRELNGLLNGRGGGSAQMAQGTFFATKDQLQAILKEKGFMSPVPCN